MSFYAPFNRVSRRSPAFFPSFQQELAPFFRAFEDLENVGRTAIRSFQPRFDVREEKDAFHLQGELPGIEQKDISIEFVDPTTLVVRGRTVKERQEGTAPSAPEGAEIKAIKNTESQSEQSENTSNYKRPSIEEDRDESDASTGAATPATTATELAKTAETEPEQQQVTKPNNNEPHYWLSERSVGEFHRAFNFPGQIDQDAVTASLKNGILSIVVPKQQPKQPRKITVQ